MSKIGSIIIVSIVLLILLLITLWFLDQNKSKDKNNNNKITYAPNSTTFTTQNNNDSLLTSTSISSSLENEIIPFPVRVLPPLSSTSSTILQERFLVVKNYNYAAGLFWCLYNVLCASHTARKYGLTLVVIFDSGLYLETNPQYLNQYKDIISSQDKNWFHYYFYPLAEGYSDIDYEIKHKGLLNHMKSFKEWNTFKNKPMIRAFEFDRDAYDSRDMNVNYTLEWNATMHLRPHMKQKIATYYQKWNMENRFVIGIAKRGLDKGASLGSDRVLNHEDFNKYLSYETNCKIIDYAIQKYAYLNVTKKPIAILAVSDEGPFIDYVHQRYDSKYEVFNTDAIRSSTTTSGLDLQSETCTPEDMRPNCVRFRQLEHESIHRGYKHLSSYQKGEDVIIEVLLLSKCQVFLRSRGNVSNFVGYISPDLPIIDMVEFVEQNNWKN